MDYVKLGRSGLEVSRLCLGCLSFGAPEEGSQPWALGEEASRQFLKQALDSGINFFDTANVYSMGASEQVLGRALIDYARRDAVVIATKLWAPMRPGPNSGGLSRKTIFDQVDASLRRLGTDYIDLYQIHRADPLTPREETLEALHDVVKAGKVRYLGASTMPAWEFMQMLAIQERNSWTRFVSMQNYYNLIYREEEREMLPLCAQNGIGVIPWSPLARGRLARPHNSGGTTRREQTDLMRSRLFDATEQIDRDVIGRLEHAAARRGVPMAEMALAWVFANPAVTAPIIGVTKEGHLETALGALSLILTEEEKRDLEHAYLPHPVLGH